MKRILAAALVLLMLNGLCACGKKDTRTDGTANEPTVGVPNPMTECASLGELNNAVGCSMCTPGVMGVTNEMYFLIDCDTFTLAEYRFTVAGSDYNLRAAAVTDDISGVYINESTAFPYEPIEGMDYAAGDGIVLARWMHEGMQYVLSAMGDVVNDSNTFSLVAEEMAASTYPLMSEKDLTYFYECYAGSYQDSYSQRATLEAVADGDSGLYITVDWASSAFETTEWTMTAELYDDGRLYYSDCTTTNYYVAADGTEEYEILEQNGSGFFTPGEGILYWDGAADES